VQFAASRRQQKSHASEQYDESEPRYGEEPKKTHRLTRVRRSLKALQALRTHSGKSFVPTRGRQSCRPDFLQGHWGLIHRAYDFSQLRWRDIFGVNVRGSEFLLRAAQQAGVRRIVFLSSISAFEGCRSLYGKGKLKVERLTQSLGGWIIRPGLVHGDKPGGIFGRLVENLRRSRVIPIPGSGLQTLHMVHEEDVVEAVLQCLLSQSRACLRPVTLAHEQPWSFRSMLLTTARALNRPVILVPVPWRIIWAGLRLAEALKIPIGFRSDSLISLVNQNPMPIFNAFEVLGIKCRPFRPGHPAPSLESPGGVC
jgi:nucleoside-diphosphate-sugar epimerase